MTEDQKRHASRLTWPLVAVVGILSTAFLVLFWLTPDPNTRSAMVMAVVGAVGTVVTVTVQKLSNKVDDHQRRVSRETSKDGE